MWIVRFVFGVIGISWLLASPECLARPHDGVVLAFHEVSVSAAVPGNLSEIMVGEGDFVRSGDLMVRIDSTFQELELARRERVLAKRKFDFEGLQSLLEDNMTSRDEALEAQIELEIAEIDHRRAMAELDQRKLKAPISGLVAGVHFEAGEWVDPGSVVVEVLDIEQVYAQLLLTAEEASRLEVGMEIPLDFPAIPDFSANGKLDFIDPRVDPASGLQRVKILLSNDGHRILPGLRCVAQLPDSSGHE